MNLTARTFTAWRFGPEELMLIKVDKPQLYRLEPPLTYRTVPDQPERWCIDLTMLAKKNGVLFYAPFDLDSRVDSSYGCVSILIYRGDYQHWDKAAKALGTVIYRLDKKVAPGCYGLAELLSDGDHFYWRAACREQNDAFLYEMSRESLKYSGEEASVYETFAIAQIIAGDRPSATSTTFSADPHPASTLLRKLKDALDSTGWDDAKADQYSTKQFGVAHWDELKEEECQSFLSLLQNVLSSRLRSGGKR